VFFCLSADALRSGLAYTFGRGECRVDTGGNDTRSRSDLSSQISFGM
jgi:hypothetical protein